MDPRGRAVQCRADLEVGVRSGVGPCLSAGTSLCEDVIPEEIADCQRLGFRAVRAQGHPRAHHHAGHQQHAIVAAIARHTRCRPENFRSR